nr:MAG TPA: hypothetical protein [Caudoviricetes sp.]
MRCGAGTSWTARLHVRGDGRCPGAGGRRNHRGSGAIFGWDHRRGPFPDLPRCCRTARVFAPFWHRWRRVSDGYRHC